MVPTPSEKPPITDSPPPEVSIRDSLPGAIAGHRNDIFFAAIEMTRMPMIVTDPHRPDNPIVFANRAFIAMTGYAMEEVLGVNCRFLQGPDTDPLAVAAIRAAVTERREYTTEILNYRKDGSSFWNALFVSPVLNEHGELTYFFASQLDVSRRRDAEEALSQAQKMEALGQLTGGISHDFNNLLQVISGQLELLRHKLLRPTPDRDSALQNVEAAKRSVARAATLTQQLLAFSRKQRLEGRVINLNTVASGILEMVQQAVGEQIQVEVRPEKALTNCQIDPSQLEVALLNVLFNARDAMPHGGTVTIKTHNIRVEAHDGASFPGLAPGDYAAISVSDTGTGIPREIVTRVMEPFFTTKEEGRGTGLGLSMVYGFAKQSGGGAQIYSEPGVGTTVRLFFPSTGDEVRNARELSGRAASRGGSERILVVDDRAEVAEVARQALHALGYEVTVAHSGREALEWMRGEGAARSPQLLFSDIIMPGGMNGVALAQEACSLLPGLRVLLTTGYAGDDAVPSTHGDARFEVIQKPYQLDELARRVRLVLDDAGAAAPVPR